METTSALDPPADGVNLLHIAAGRRAAIDPFLLVPENPDSEFIHDLRVLTRRLTEVARLLQPLMEKPAAAALVDSLRTLRRSTGELRDLDVLGEHLLQWELPAALKPLADQLVADLPARRCELAGQLRQQIASPGLAASLHYLAAILEQAAANPAEPLKQLGSHLAKTTRKRRKQLRDQLGKAARKQSQEQFHNARIAAKKLRYSLELADESGLQAHKAELKFLKKFQSLLGDMHDADVMLHTLRARLAQSPPADSADWQSFQDATHLQQAKRAGEALVLGYRWINRQIE